MAVDSQAGIGLWDVKKERFIQQLDAGRRLYPVRFSPSGSHLLVADREELMIWNTSQDSVVSLEFSPDEAQVRVAFSNYGVLAVGDAANISLVNVSTGETRTVIPTGTTASTWLDMDASGQCIYTSAPEQRIRIIDLNQITNDLAKIQLPLTFDKPISNARDMTPNHAPSRILQVTQKSDEY